ncbi:MAG: hypothetical protein AB7P01_16525 [Bacteroidia bacterium]
MKLPHLIILSFISIFFVSCSQNLDRDSAKVLFENSSDIPHVLVGDFSLYQQYYKPKEYLLACEKYGLMKLVDSYDNYRMGLNQYWKFQVTDEGKKYFVKEASYSKGKVALLTLCSLKVKEVTGIKFLNEDKSKACIEYKLCLEDITKAGEMFNEVEYASGKAKEFQINNSKIITFNVIGEKYDDGWRLNFKVPESNFHTNYKYWMHGNKDLCKEND